MINDEKDPDVWRPPKIDENEVKEAKKFATPERKVRGFFEATMLG